MRTTFRSQLPAESFSEIGGFQYPLASFQKVRSALYRHVLSRPYLSQRSPRQWSYFSRLAERKARSISGNKIILAPTTAFFAFWEKRSDETLVSWNDGTFKQFVDYWPSHQNLHPSFIEMGDRLERLALENTDLCLFSSRWGLDSARTDYQLSPSKSKFVPYGANLPEEMLEVAATAVTKERKGFRLLSVAVEWKRKGMGTSIEIVSTLRAMGFNAELDIVGALPPPGVKVPSYVHLHGRLSKTIPEESQKLTALFCNASLFVLLPESDASPIVLNEAAAFGLPRVSRNTGGIKDMITGGVDGIVIDENCLDPKLIAERIRPWLANASELDRVRRAARVGFEQRWNWKTQCSEVLKLGDFARIRAASLS